ncbi:MAG: 30S ribosomal protein S4 [Armatimonadota bacterium]
MARYTQASCRLCRREGKKMFLKGSRCYTGKCALDRRLYAPGVHGKLRKKTSQYGIQLREKQKLKRIYSIGETQFRNYFRKAAHRKGVTGEIFLQILESRLDNIIYRLGFAASRNQARQLVSHGHFTVNGKKVDVPSYLTKAGDVIVLREKSRQIPQMLESFEEAKKRSPYNWLEIHPEEYKGVVKGIPSREELDISVKEELIVEYYSK